MKILKVRFQFIFSLFILMIMSLGVMEQKNVIAKQNNISGEDTNDKTIKFPEVYEENIDEGLRFQARIYPPVNLQNENVEIQVTYKDIDFDTALKELFADVGKIKREEMIIQPENSLYQSAYGEQDEVMANGIGMFRMEKTHWKKVKNAIEISQKDLRYNAELYMEPRQFDFGTSEEIWDKLQITLHKLGVEEELKATTFYMDYQTMEKEDEKDRKRNEDRAVEDKSIWNKADNGYYISAVQCINGNTVFANTYFGNGIEGKEDTANVLAYIDESGIQMLELTRIIDQTYETEKTWEMLPFEEIINAVKKRFGLVITGDKVEIEEFQFSYMTEAIDENVYRLIPVWFCNYRQIGQDGSERMHQLIVHAATGEEVLYELY